MGTLYRVLELFTMGKKFQDKLEEWQKVDKGWEEVVRDANGTEVGRVDLSRSLIWAEDLLSAGGALTVYGNGRGPLDRTGSDVVLPESDNHSMFYEFDMVDRDGNPVRVNGRRHEFRVVLDVDFKNKIQAGWMSSAHYGTDGTAKRGWKLIRHLGVVKS